MYFRHNLDYKYPEKSDEHMIHVKRIREVKCDENYPYVSKGFWGWFKRVTFFIMLHVIVIPVVSIRHNLRIYGKENYKKHKKEFKNGAITVSNHVLMWDYLCVLKAIRPHLPYFPAWENNLEGPNGPLIRWASGVPVPIKNFRGMAKFTKEMDNLFKQNKWIHFFPEGSMWFYYPDIRPLKKAVFKYAYKYDSKVGRLLIGNGSHKGYECAGVGNKSVFNGALGVGMSCKKLRAVCDIAASVGYLGKGNIGIHAYDYDVCAILVLADNVNASGAALANELVGGHEKDLFARSEVDKVIHGDVTCGNHLIGRCLKSHIAEHLDVGIRRARCVIGEEKHLFAVRTKIFYKSYSVVKGLAAEMDRTVHIENKEFFVVQ